MPESTLVTIVEIYVKQKELEIGSVIFRDVQNGFCRLFHLQ